MPRAESWLTTAGGHLGHAVRRRLELEHHVDQRTLQAGAGAAIDRKTGAAHLGAGSQVEDAQALTDLPVRLTFPTAGVVGDGLTPLAHRLRQLRRADGHISVCRIGYAQQQVVQLGLDSAQLFLAAVNPATQLN